MIVKTKAAKSFVMPIQSVFERVNGQRGKTITGKTIPLFPLFFYSKIKAKLTKHHVMMKKRPSLFHNPLGLDL